MIKRKAELKVFSRKERRKEERSKKKQKRRPHEPKDELVKPTKVEKISEPTKAKAPAKEKKAKNNDPYAHLDQETAAALRREDEEIAEMEAKLGLADKKERARLHKEYAKLECYGDDFGEFLDNLDSMEARWRDDDPSATAKGAFIVQSDQEDLESEDTSDDEMVPMKSPDYDLDEDDSVMAEIEAEERQKSADPEADSSSESSEEESDAGSEEEESDAEEGEGEAIVYKPKKGEDIYGNKVGDAKEVVGEKYVPPHLRKKTVDQDADDAEAKRTIRKSLNSALNRLSEETVVPVVSDLVNLFKSHPTTLVNECLWENLKAACVSEAQIVKNLIPPYIAALAGTHIELSSNAQVAEYVMERAVLELFDGLTRQRKSIGEEPDYKVPSNLTLIVGYMYNFGLIHCTLVYDLIRDLVESFQEIDVEVLLLLLTHCGRSLRTDDPMALKDIVILVNQRNSAAGIASSRSEYMLSAISDLKNNRKRKQDEVHSLKVSKLRKVLGSIKSKVAAQGGAFRSSEASLKISLKDIREAETKGRWWRVGASWQGLEREEVKERQNIREETSELNPKLIKLADKYKMNSETKRAIFCVIMGSADYEDAFEKLVRARMLVNRKERETVRVIMECCGHEKAFNEFYSHLAHRICEYQAECRFSFQLAYWDFFKQIDDFSLRKVANLAKLLFQLVAVHPSLKLNVLKPFDLTAKLTEPATIFVTVFLSNILEYYDDSSTCASLFERACLGGKSRRKGADEDEMVGEDQDDGEILATNLTVFLNRVMKSSPKYEKGSKFRSNLKAAIKACDPDNFL